MLKVTTRLFFAGAMAATLVAVNTGAFAAETHKTDAQCKMPCCMKSEHTAAKKAAKGASAKTVSGEPCGDCCKKAAAATKTSAKAPAKVAAKAKVKS
jgi:hypothetical protein